MAHSYSYSKRSTLESCPRRYFYDYYTPAAPATRTDKQSLLWDDLSDDFSSGPRRTITASRVALIRRAKALSNCDAVAGQILHSLIGTFLKKGGTWSTNWLLGSAGRRFDEAVVRSRQNRDVFDQSTDLPAQLLLEFVYGDPEAESLALQTRQKLLAAMKNFLDCPEVVDLWRPRLNDSVRVERSIAGLSADGFTIGGRVDFASRIESDVQIVDWKIGRWSGSCDSLQLLIYGWWATKEFDVDATGISVQRVFLWTPTVESSVRLDEVLLRRARARLFQDIELMNDLDRYGQAGNEEAFSPCGKENVCRRCKYQVVCPATSCRAAWKPTSELSQVGTAVR